MNTLGLAAQPTEYDAPRHPVASPCRVSLRPRGLDVDIDERFWARVDASGDCWEWTGTVDNGYGSFRGVRAHRWAYEDLVGAIPVGLQLDHLCRNHSCVNPDHLEPVTQAENIRRGFAPPALNARKTHCPKGHEYSPENTWTNRRRQRFCRTCHRAKYHRLTALRGRYAVKPDQAA